MGILSVRQWETVWSLVLLAVVCSGGLLVVSVGLLSLVVPPISTVSMVLHQALGVGVLVGSIMLPVSIAYLIAWNSIVGTKEGE